MKYAKRTQVPVSRSRTEIETTVMRYGADQFGSAFDAAGGRAMVQFRLASWLVRFILPLPHDDAQDQRQRWRALCLVIKAKLEAVESGIATVEEEFLPHIVVPGGGTFAEWAVPQLREMRKRLASCPPRSWGNSKTRVGAEAPAQVNEAGGCGDVPRDPADPDPILPDARTPRRGEGPGAGGG